MKRTLALILALVLIFGAMLGVVSTADSSSETGSLKISQANLQFADTVYLLIAVDYSALYSDLAAASAAVTLKIKNNATGSEVILDPDASVVLDGHVCFTYKTLGAKNFGDELSLQALNSGVASGDAKTYSILEYALKGISGDDALLAALCEDMLAFGDAAQTAFGTKASASYDLAKDYGVVVVNGSNEGKAIAEAGSSVSFTANTAKTGANAALHDDSFAKVDGITVSKGYSRYIYIGDSQRNLINLDMTTTTAADFANYPLVRDNSATTGDLYVNFFTNRDKTNDKMSGTEATDFAKPYARIYPITTASNRGGIITSTIVPGSHWELTAEKSQSIAVQIAGSNKALYKNSNDGVFTMVFTLGKDGLAKMTTASSRIRGSSSSNVSNYFIIKNEGNNSIIHGINNNDNKFDSTGTDPIPFATIKGEEGKQNFITFYVVVDPNANTYTYYAQGSDGKLTTNAASGSGKTINDVMNASGGIIDWTMAPMPASTTLVRRIVFLNGNIFE